MKVLATSWHPGGANAIIPVVRRLRDDAKVEVVVIGHEFSEASFKGAGLGFKTLGEYGLTDVSPESMCRLLAAEVPSIVLTGTSSQEGGPIDIIEQTITLAARRAGVVSVAVLDTWEHYRPRFEDVRTGETFDRLPDRVAIMDAIARDEMMEEGFPEEALVITGNPHFDSLAAKAQAFTPREKEEVRERIGLAEHPTLFFFAGNGFSATRPVCGYWDGDVIEAIRLALPSIPEVGVAIRLHPRMPVEDKLEIQRIISSLGNVKLVDDVNSQTLALAADLTIVEASTIGIEAVLMKRPVISLEPDLKTPVSLLISRKGVVPAGYTVGECVDFLKMGADPRYRDELLLRSAGFATDGKATERVVQLVYSLLA